MRQYSIFLSDRNLIVVLEHLIRKFACRKFISNENGVENRPKWWLFFRKSWNLVPDSKLALLFFENFTVDFQISYFREKNSTYKSQCFKKFYHFILCHGLDSPGLNRMGLKKDVRNDNLFFKRVTDIIIPDYPLSIDM